MAGLRCVRLWRLAAILVVAGCAPAPPAARHTVEEYRADAALRSSALDTCANDPARCVDTRTA